MIPANAYRIHFAATEEFDSLRRLAEFDSQKPLAGRVLIGEIDGTPAAALSLRDGRVVSDPYRRTDHLVAVLQMRARAIRAYEATPALRDRLRAAFAEWRVGTVVQFPVPRTEEAEPEPQVVRGYAR